MPCHEQYLSGYFVQELNKYTRIHTLLRWIIPRCCMMWSKKIFKIRFTSYRKKVYTSYSLVPSSLCPRISVLGFTKSVCLLARLTRDEQQQQRASDSKRKIYKKKKPNKKRESSFSLSRHWACIMWLQLSFPYSIYMIIKKTSVKCETFTPWMRRKHNFFF